MGTKADRSIRKKLLFATISTLLFFGALELAFAMIGVRATTDTSDPFVGFSNQVPLFEMVGSHGSDERMRTAKSKLVWFNDQEFLKKKPPGTRRVFCLGGSTTYGRPYSDPTSFAGWLRELLPYVDQTDWEVINAGGVSYASYRVATVMEELVQYEPDLFIVYTGQNEFLERRTYANFFDSPKAIRFVNSALRRTRTWAALETSVRRLGWKTQSPADTATTLPGEVDERLNHTVGPSDYERDAKWRSEVLKHCQFNLERMIKISRNASAKIVFVVPASNEKDCSPFKSDISPELTREDQLQIEQLLASVSTEDTGQNEGMTQASKLQTLKAALDIDDRLPGAAYQIGKIHFENGEYDLAAKSFRNAVDWDVCPLRAPSEILDMIRAIESDRDVQVVDFDEKLRSKCAAEFGHQILGEEYFLDHVHPTIEAHRDLALWIINDLQEAAWLPKDEFTATELETVQSKIDSGIDPIAQGIALRNLAKVLHWAGKFSEAEPRARDALELLGSDAESMLVLSDCLRQTNRQEEAIVVCEEMLATYPLFARGYHLYGSLMLDVEAYDAAKESLLVAVQGLPEGSPQQDRAKWSLGIASLGLNDFQLASKQFEHALSKNENDTDAMFHLAECKAGLDDNTAAISIYEQLLSLQPQDVEARVNLGFLYLGENQLEQAKAQFELAFDTAPMHVRAKSGMEVVAQLLAQ